MRSILGTKGLARHPVRQAASSGAKLVAQTRHSFKRAQHGYLLRQEWRCHFMDGHGKLQHLSHRQFGPQPVDLLDKPPDPIVR